jgi:hypothetical protein
MPREYYSISPTKDQTVLISELNRILDSISRRLNYIIDDGDNVSLDGKQITNVSAGMVNSDGVRLDQVVTRALIEWIAGTTNQVIVTDDGDDSVTLSTPQDTHTGASPTFVTETLTGLTASRLVGSDGSKVLESIANLASWIAGTDLQPVNDDGDGTVSHNDDELEFFIQAVDS